MSKASRLMGKDKVATLFFHPYIQVKHRDRRISQFWRLFRTILKRNIGVDYS
jgi:hypothetical protein